MYSIRINNVVFTTVSTRKTALKVIKNISWAHSTNEIELIKISPKFGNLQEAREYFKS